MKKGFTLLELMIVIVILGVLAAFISGNFLSSLSKGRDARRKSDLSNIQRALESYYEDNKTYPSSLTFGTSLKNPAATKTYMQIVPDDPQTTNNYQYCTDATYSQWQLYAKLENTSDRSIITPAELSSCTAACSGGCNYGISSPNTTPD